MIPDRYNISAFYRACYNPIKFLNEIGYIKDKTISKEITKIRHGGGIDVMNEQWDNLIILDSCRYDIFSQNNTLDGELKKVISKSSRSLEFIEKNFFRKSFPDTTYISPKEETKQLRNEGVFGEIIYTLEEPYYGTYTTDQWKLDPKHIYKTFEKNRPYNSDRVIIHFMQPHSPYFGNKAKSLRKKLYNEKNVLCTQLGGMNDQQNNQKRVNNLMEAAKHDYISDDQLREVYIENLELVLEYVEKLTSEMNGKTVITSDHGDLLGNPKCYLPPQRYGHPPNTYTSELRTVPWFITSQSN